MSRFQFTEFFTEKEQGIFKKTFVSRLVQRYAQRERVVTTCVVRNFARRALNPLLNDELES
jgi:hypothetical protein